jgi:hypothetical protein
MKLKRLYIKQAEIVIKTLVSILLILSIIIILYSQEV